MERVSYAERAAGVAGAVLWQSRAGPEGVTTRVLPDACVDLLWDGAQLQVAGPDSTARLHRSAAGARWTALRLSGGLGPALLGVPADELRDRLVPLDGLWPARRLRGLAAAVADDPVRGLEDWLVRARAGCEVDPVGPALLAGAHLPVDELAARCGLSPRQLHRRSLMVFGHGPRRVGRVLRFGRAVAAARAGRPLAAVAADCGYADQAHLSREVRELAGLAPVRLLRELAGPPAGER